MNISIRLMALEDAARITVLSRQLGYSITETETEQHIKMLSDHSDHDIFSAIHEGEVIGWIHVFYAIQLESPSFCEIRGLVVDEHYRHMGVGSLLVEKAKSWCTGRGNTLLRVRCNIKRKEAHLFYERTGFREIKEQKIFEINTGR